MSDWTFEKYLEHRFETSEEGRWSDLVDGKLVFRDQPSDAQGQAIFNLTRLLGQYFQTPASGAKSYACFELGLILSRNPDTLRFPLVSIYESGDRFAHLDDQVTEELPQVVVEHYPQSGSALVLSQHYLAAGIQEVWLLNEPQQQVEIHRAAAEPQLLRAEETISGAEFWPEMSLDVAELFKMPE